MCIYLRLFVSYNEGIHDHNVECVLPLVYAGMSLSFHLCREDLFLDFTHFLFLDGCACSFTS